MAAALVIAAQARASFYSITFNDGIPGGSSANGLIDVSGTTAVDGWLTVTSGPQSPGTYDLIPGSGTIYGGGGGFNYDNQVLVGSHPFLDNSGLLFGNGTVLLNLWGNNGQTGFAEYSFYGVPPAYSPEVNGTATLTAVPEPTTMIAGALLLLPFGASTIRILRRKQ